MARLEQQSFRRLPSVAPTVTGRDAALRPSLTGSNTVDDTESILTVRGPITDAQNAQSSDQREVFGYSFDQDLNASRPYTRAMQKARALSTTSSEILTMGWSCLSGLSLAEISNISVINLLFCPQDLWNGHRYSEVKIDHGGLILSYHRRSPLKSEATQTAPRLTRRLNTRASLPVSVPPSRMIGEKTVPVAARTMLLSGMFPSRFTNGPCCDFRLINDSNLLGRKLSGKTTVYNHLQILYGNGITELERLTAFEFIIRKLVHIFIEAFSLWSVWSDYGQKPDREVRGPVTNCVIW